MRVRGGIGEKLEEEGLGEVVRARAGDQVASGSEEFERAEIDFFVTTDSGVEGVFVFGERRRVEDDHVEAARRVVELFEEVERVGFVEGDVVERV